MGIITKSSNIIVKGSNIITRPVSLIKYGKYYSTAAASSKTLITGFSLSDYAWGEGANLWSAVGHDCIKHGHSRKNGTPVLSAEYNTSTHPRWDAHATVYAIDQFNFSLLPAGGYSDSTSAFSGLGQYGFVLHTMVDDFASVGAVYNQSGVTVFGPEGLNTVRLFRSPIGSEANVPNGTIVGTTTDYDGNLYQLVKVANVIWIRQNLATTKYADGTSISGVRDYNDDSTNTFFANEGESIW